MQWRPGLARSNDVAKRLPPWRSFFVFKEIYVYRRGTYKERRSFCQFADSENVKSITTLKPFYHHCLGNENCN